jgi:hypothetical protein
MLLVPKCHASNGIPREVHHYDLTSNQWDAEMKDLLFIENSLVRHDAKKNK